MRIAYRLFFCCLVALVVFSSQVKATDIPTIVDKLDGKFNELVAGAQATVDVSTAQDFSNIASFNRIHNVITFKVNEESSLFFSSSFTATLQYKIYFEDESNLLDSTGVQTLEIAYDTSSTYKQRASFHFYGGYKVTVKIIGISTSVGNVVLPALVLLNEMHLNVEYNFVCAADSVTSLMYVTDSSQYDELFVSWNAANGADEYDLEWAYVDSTALANYKTGNNFNALLIYENNATRVSITDSTHYRIPLLYDHGGVLFFRVRAIQNRNTGKRVEGVWSWWGHGVYGFYGHERALNWQATTSFAEEGKRKSVVQYFDGTLRARQTVTKDNSLGTTIIAETFYDYQGRPTIHVLPAPTLNTIIAYAQNFNVNDNGVEYDKSEFDSLKNASAYCGIAAPPMGIQSGAAKYYSPDNPESSSGIHQYIPTANGFAFTETQYMPDNTGRIARQSGVGADHRLGSGHETTYSYGQPSQKELDGLFGTEVGDYTHYQKNLVRDANGQYSVSYVDMNGRTIATALAGQAPEGMDALSSYNLITVTEPLITPASNNTNGLSMVASKGLLVPRSGPHRFVYSLLPDSIALANCEALNICYDCYYDLEITISNECNNNGFPNNKPISIKRSNLTFDSVDVACNARVPFPAVDTTLQLAEGSYLVTKKLTVSRWAMEYYRDSVFLPNNTCKTKEEFIQDALDSLRLQPSDCNPDCASCLSSVGTWNDFHASYMAQSGYAVTDTALYLGEAKAAYKNALDICASLCNSAGDDVNIRRTMLWDVSPSSGQYANSDPDSLDNTYSIFFKDPFDGDTARYAQRNLLYLDENGKPDTLIINGVPVLPQELSPEEFAKRFKASWAETLLPFHPEFCKLKEYEKYSDSHAWDVRFNAVETYQAAKDSGFLDPTPGGTFPFNQYPNGADPLFNKGYMLGGTLLKSLMEDKMVNFQQIDAVNNEWISMWALATLTTVCTTGDATCANSYKSDGNAFHNTPLCEGDLDMAWRSFKSFYQNAKREFVRSLIDVCVTPNLLHYQPRFIDPAAHLPNPYTDINDTTAALNDVKSKMGANYVANCEAYAAQWLYELSQCSAYDTTQLKLNVLPKLIQVCIKGSDATHPYGSSTISPDSSYAYNSFEAVMQWYNNTLNLDTSKRSICNSYLITGLKPYNQPAVYAELPVWNKPDSCTCEKIEELYTDYQTNNSSFSTFSAYLKAVHHTTISQGALDTLRGLCSGAITCNYLATPISLPAALQCGVSNVCIDCEEMRNEYSAYLTQFPGSIPGVDTTEGDTTQYLINTVFANYLNAQLGFSYSAGEYLAFMQQCKIGTSSYADTLWRRIADFRNYYNSVSQSQVWRTWKITPLTKNYIDYLNVLLKASMSPVSPVLPPGYALRPYSTALNVKMKSVVRNTSNATDSTFHIIAPFPLQYTIDYSQSIPGFAHLATNIVKPSDFVTGTASLEELSDKYFAVTAAQRSNYFHNMWVGTANWGAYPYYGYSTPDSTFIPWYESGFYSWENHIQAVAFYKPGLSVINPATYVTYHIDSVFKGTWWADFGNNTIKTNEIKKIKNLRFDQTVLPLADMWNFANNPTGLKVTLELRNGTEADAFIYSTYPGYIRFKEAIDSNLYNPDCKAAFTYFFNQRSDSTYTTAQIDSILMVNGILFDYCNLGADTTQLLCGKTEVFAAIDPNSSNCVDSMELAVAWGTELYNAYRDSIKGAFEAAYLKKCLEAFNHETFTVTRPHSEYHYTLYYYDQAGNLVKTVPPAGVVNKIGDASFLANVKVAKAAGTVLTPAHSLKTEYRYNTLNQVVAQTSPDGGTSQFWYDRLGRLAVSQNAQQALEYKYSYTLYDQIGRIKEVGEKFSTEDMDHDIGRDVDKLNDWINDNGTRSQITRTVYDVANTLIEPELYQKNLRNRVSYTAYVEADGEPYQSATYYSYDIHGNVDTLLQDYQAGLMSDWGNRFKKMVYRYDLISGKVNHVAYQPKQKDAFYHRYLYDAENKLTDVYTSRDSLHWEREASYSYYKHGPLARIELGQQRVQGVDYAYTLQGWLKGVNSTLLCEGRTDMGRDGVFDEDRKMVARDAYGFALHYYDSDYFNINQTSKFSGGYISVGFRIADQATYRPLYNGNISAMSVNIGKLEMPAIYNYRYDQLNRLAGMEFLFAQNNCENDYGELWDNETTRDESYEEQINYDPNGNIITYQRYGNASRDGLDMDNLEYHYYPGSNKLRSIFDYSDPNNYEIDIDEQDQNNYTYDAIGNLVYDAASFVDNIEWTVYGKIKSIYKSNDPSGIEQIHYTYDASGNRISKRVLSGSEERITWYVRDASGNVMAVYTISDEMGALKLDEQHLYGSSRLGIERPEINVTDGLPPGSSMGTLGVGYEVSFERGRKYYELTNHLGNVLVTISDKKIQHDEDKEGEVEWYEPYVVNAQDYYPFGMLMPERQWSYGSHYRYGFNGKENDNEVKGVGNQIAFEERIYDPRLGRFLTRDPLERNYAWQSPYAFAANNPIRYIDVFGMGPGDPPAKVAADGSYFVTPSRSKFEYFSGDLDGTSSTRETTNGTTVNVLNGSVRAISITEGTKTTRYVAEFSDKGGFIGYKDFESKSYLNIQKTGITVQMLKAAADELGAANIHVIAAFMFKESFGMGYTKAGDIKVLFERHYMYNFLNKKFGAEKANQLAKEHPDIVNPKNGGYGSEKFWNQDGSYDNEGYYNYQTQRLQMAMTIDKESALKSASYGAFQIMGSFFASRYSSLESMYQALLKNPSEQVMFFVAEIKSSHKDVQAAMKNLDFKTMSNYNGNWQKYNPTYPALLKSYYEKSRSK